MSADLQPENTDLMNLILELQIKNLAYNQAILSFLVNNNSPATAETNETLQRLLKEVEKNAEMITEDNRVRSSQIDGLENERQ